jgi:annexin A7/11
VIPVPPSLGYVPGQIATGDATKEAKELRGAMKGMGTDEAALIRVLAKPDPLRMALIHQTYIERIGRDLEKDIKSETSNEFERALVGLINGPLGNDVRTLKNAFKGVGTDEDALDDVLIGRSNADMKAIKLEYLKTYKKSLEAALKSELSGKTERFFVMLIEANRPEPGTYFDPQSVDADVREIHGATEGREGTDEVAVAAIFIGATDAKLCAISEAYERKYRMSLEKVIKDEFTGHLEKALVAMLQRAKDPVGEIASRLWTCLGAGGGAVKYDRVLYWVIKLHWDTVQFDAVKTAFKKNHGTDLTVMLRTKMGAVQYVGELVAKMIA